MLVGAGAWKWVLVGGNEALVGAVAGNACRWVETGCCGAGKSRRVEARSWGVKEDLNGK